LKGEAAGTTSSIGTCITCGDDKFDRRVVGDQTGQLHVDDPVEQPAIVAVEAAAGFMQVLGVRPAVHRQQRVGKAGVQADHVAGVDGDAVGFENAHQPVVADRFAPPSDVMLQVDQHTAALRAMLGQLFDAERTRVGPGKACPVGHGIRVFGGAADLLAGAKAVVEHRLGLAIAIGIEAASHVRQAVPLRRVLGVHQQHLVAHHVGERIVLARVRPAEALLPRAPAVAQRGERLRRQAARVERHAARYVERQREAEGQTFLHLGDALQNLGAIDQVHSAALVIGAEFAPMAGLRRLLPPLRHAASAFFSGGSRM
jgi:hypothetical protein